MNVRITVKRITRYPDLMEAYENPLENACGMAEGMCFLSEGGKMPPGFCAAAWETLGPFAEALARGEGDFYGGWMKDPRTALLSCNDGFRPVSFLLEALPE